MVPAMLVGAEGERESPDGETIAGTFALKVVD